MMRAFSLVLLGMVAVGAVGNPIDLTEPTRLWDEVSRTGACSDPDQLARFICIHGLRFFGGVEAVADSAHYARVAPVLELSQGPGYRVHVGVQAQCWRWADADGRQAMIVRLRSWLADAEEPAVLTTPHMVGEDVPRLADRQRARAAEALYHLDDPDLPDLMDRALARPTLRRENRTHLRWLHDRLADPDAHRFLIIDDTGKLENLLASAAIDSVTLIKGDHGYLRRFDRLDDLDRQPSLGPVPVPVLEPFWRLNPLPAADRVDDDLPVHEIGLLVHAAGGLRAVITPTHDGRLRYYDNAWALHIDCLVFSWPSFLAELTQVGR